MLKNALFYEKQLQDKFIEVWYDPRFQYYFGTEQRRVVKLDNPEFHRAFVSVDKDDNVLGYINYCIYPELRLVDKFGAINFSNNKFIFGKDLIQAIDDIFMKFNYKVMEFACIIGNPEEENYDRFVEKLEGRVIGVRTGRATDLRGNICDDKLYEITKTGYERYLAGKTILSWYRKNRKDVDQFSEQMGLNEVIEIMERRENARV